MTVTYQVLNLSKGGGSNNLLINPRGKINQLDERDGVLAAGVYFCDGWKAGASGAEVYRDPDGFRLISGSIVQLVPNNLDAGRRIRANMDIISGTPSIRINGGGDDVLSNSQQYITVEISGNNSKFTRIILAESLEIPIYQQSSNELEQCERFLQIISGMFIEGYSFVSGVYVNESIAKKPIGNVAVSYTLNESLNLFSIEMLDRGSTLNVFLRSNGVGRIFADISNIVLDARP
ncbi:hypothetical protein ACK8QL_04290 [Vibrio cholerae]|uniref:hypothetical protein n=1 Tax=Vibrio cholerae TaxID=666 RepID=UPI0039767AF4